MAASVTSLCLASAYYPPHMGGVEVFTQNLARELLRRNIDVTVVANGVEDAGESRTPEGITLFRMPARDPLGRFPLPLRNMQSRELWGRLASRHFDGYVVNTRFYPLMLKMLAHAKQQGARPVLIEHGSAYLSIGNPLVDAGMHRYEDAIAARVRAADPHCFGVSQEASDWLRHFGLESEGVIHNSIDATVFATSASSRDFRAEYGIPVDACLITFTGRIIAEKGIWTLLDIARVLEHENFYFIVAGAGPQEQALKALKPSNMKLAGRLSHEDVAALLKQADIYCYPSTYPEGLPTSLLEAAACEASIITTAVAGAHEIIPSPEYGTIVKEATPEAFLQAIRHAWDNRDVMRVQANNCAAHVASAFSWERAANTLLSVWG